MCFDLGITIGTQLVEKRYTFVHRVVMYAYARENENGGQYGSRRAADYLL